MSKFVNITGHRFGTLVAIEYTKRHTWICVCDCGRQREVRTGHLNNGDAHHCGYRPCRSDALPLGIAARNRLLGKYKRRARLKNHPWLLSSEDAFLLFESQCYYCGVLPSQTIRGLKNSGDYIFNGIDRVDNQRGYLTTNCVPCCMVCNRGKGAMTTQEWDNYMDRIVQWRPNESPPEEG